MIKECSKNGSCACRARNTVLRISRRFANGKRRAGCFPEMKLGEQMSIFGRPRRKFLASLISVRPPQLAPRGRHGRRYNIAVLLRSWRRVFGFIARVFSNSFALRWSWFFRRYAVNWPLHGLKEDRV